MSNRFGKNPNFYRKKFLIASVKLLADCAFMQLESCESISAGGPGGEAFLHWENGGRGDVEIIYLITRIITSHQIIKIIMIIDHNDHNRIIVHQIEANGPVEMLVTRMQEAIHRSF